MLFTGYNQKKIEDLCSEPTQHFIKLWKWALHDFNSFAIIIEWYYTDTLMFLKIIWTEYIKLYPAGFQSCCSNLAKGWTATTWVQHLDFLKVSDLTLDKEFSSGNASFAGGKLGSRAEHCYFAKNLYFIFYCDLKVTFLGGKLALKEVKFWH